MSILNIMKLRAIHIILLITICIIYTCDNDASEKHFSEETKVALREVGNKLLLINNDSISLISPVTKLEKNRFEITFENTLEITPDSLVYTVGSVLKKANLPKRYIVEVVNCESQDVFYSFKISGLEEQNIIPCVGRKLPNACYKIQVLFLENDSVLTSNFFVIVLSLVLVGLIVLVFFFKFRRQQPPSNIESAFSKIGTYKFYKEQNKLVKDSVEIKLSAKECELMAILSKNQNKIVKREMLVKEVWEDRGVFVDRSLDTFISKLRKKFKDDASINIVNVHGVGYKLEVD